MTHRLEHAVTLVVLDSYVEATTVWAGLKRGHVVVLLAFRHLTFRHRVWVGELVHRAGPANRQQQLSAPPVIGPPPMHKP
jgi:hypothetical protein